MSETSIISNQEFSEDVKQSRCLKNCDPELYANFSKLKNPSCCLKVVDRSQLKILDESDLEELLLVIRSKHKCNGVESYEITQKDWSSFYPFPRLLLTNNTNENQLDPFVLQPSIFHKNHVPPTVYFSTKFSDESRPPVGLPTRLQPYFKWKISSITPNSIRNCVSFMNFEALRPSNTADNLYLGSWCKHMLTAEFGQLEEWRKVNHYPGSFHLGRKDKLWYRLRSAIQKHGKDKFDTFHPTTFVLPRDYEDLNEYWQSSPSKLFIMKPPASARGNGIKVINDISQIPESALAAPIQADGLPSKKSTVIVQQYISNPCLLENGQKFDLRIYVLLTSVDPLRIYVYDEGLVRFASTRYTSQEDGLIDQYMHLTNYFINKNNQEYQINNDSESLDGCKWTLKRFWRYLREHYAHIDGQLLWKRIIDIIIKTIICCEGPMTRISHQNCKNDYTAYELFGFDIILDENFKPWILEVNITPSLKSESDLDTSVKYGVIKDMFNLVGYNLPPVPTEEASRLGNLAEFRLFFDKRLYTDNLTKYDKLKHAKYLKIYKGDFGSQGTCARQATGSQDKEQKSQPNHVPNIEESEINGLNNADHRYENQMNPTVENYVSDGHTNTTLACDSILNDLTQNDIRILMLAEDELSRCGQFKRVFPSEGTSGYLRYFDKPRYNNLLLDAWERKYRDNRLEGINHLSSLATFLD